MARILLDTDASIKLTKIGIMEIVSSGFDIILTEQVYKEQVIAGLKRGLPDAKRMEILVLEGKITVSKVMEKSFVENFRLGAGEKSVMDYYLSNDIDLIVSDDEAFLRTLDICGIPFTPVAGVILMCVFKGLISKEKGIKYLELLKPMIKEEHMFYIKSKIEGLK